MLSQGPDRHLNDIMIGAYNDWHVDEWCGAYPERFIPCGILPLYDVDRATVEVHRLAAKGCHAVPSPRTPRRWEWPAFTAAIGTRSLPPAPRRERCCAATSARRHRLVHTSADAPASVAISLSSVTSIFTMVDLDLV